MKRSQNTTALIIAVLVALVLAAIAWFLLIGPKLDAASFAQEQTESQRLTNDNLRAEIETLKAEAERLPELREELWRIRDAFPPQQDVPGLRDLIAELYGAHGLVIQSDSIGLPGPIENTLALAPAYAAVGKESYVEGIQFSGLIVTPVTVTTRGPRAAVLSLLDDLQVGDHRYFSVYAYNLEPLEADPSTVPPTGNGWAELTVSMYVFTLDYGVPDASLRPEPAPLPGTTPLPSEVVPDSGDSETTPFG